MPGPLALMWTSFLLALTGLFTLRVFQRPLARRRLRCAMERAHERAEATGPSEEAPDAP